MFLDVRARDAEQLTDAIDVDGAGLVETDRECIVDGFGLAAFGTCRDHVGGEDRGLAAAHRFVVEILHGEHDVDGRVVAEDAFEVGLLLPRPAVVFPRFVVEAFVDGVGDLAG